MSTTTGPTLRSALGRLVARVSPTPAARPIDGPLAADEVWEQLRNERRRAVVRIIATGEREVWPRRDLTEAVLCEVEGVTPAEIRPDARKRVHVALYQNHLPKLADAGAVEWVDRKAAVRPTDGMAQLHAALDAVERVGGGA